MKGLDKALGKAIGVGLGSDWDGVWKAEMGLGMGLVWWGINCRALLAVSSAQRDSSARFQWQWSLETGRCGLCLHSCGAAVPLSMPLSQHSISVAEEAALR